MDTLEKLARQAAETINGGEFYDGKWYTEGQRQAWLKAMTPAAEEIEHLRQLNERFGKALQKIAVSGSDEGAWKIAYEAIMRTMWGE